MRSFEKAGLICIDVERHNDARGYFAETFNKEKFMQLTGLQIDWVQDNQSFSKKAGTIRGLHFQKPPFAQAKLVSCRRGAIFDVAVDIRKGSDTYGEWWGLELSETNRKQFLIPIGFAHGFVTLVPNTEVFYKCSDYYNVGSEGCLNWRDPSINIDWPLDGEPLLSDKDAFAPFFNDFESPF